MAKDKQKRNLNVGDKTADQVIIQVDADCFEFQVWTKNYPFLQDKPVIITNSANVILTANYPARGFGISPKSYHHSIKEAFEKCPELIQKTVPDRWGKCDLQTLRLVNYSFVDCLEKYRRDQEADIIVDFCGKEEFYADISKLVSKRLETMKTANPNSFFSKTIMESNKSVILNDSNAISDDFWNSFGDKDKRLLVGGMIANEIVETLKTDTGFQFSAGVAPNKLLATLACAKNKPAAVTILNEEGLSRLASQIKTGDIRNLGGKMGQEIITELNLDTMEKLREIPEQFWIKRFGEKKGSLVHRLSWGIDNEKVTETSSKPKIKCALNLLAREGTRVITDLEGLQVVLNDLAEEIVEWLEEEKVRRKRRPNIIGVNLSRPRLPDSVPIPDDSVSFTCSEVLTEEEIVTKSLELLQKIWTIHGMRPLQELTEIKITAKNFVFL